MPVLLLLLPLLPVPLFEGDGGSGNEAAGAADAHSGGHGKAAVEGGHTAAGACSEAASSVGTFRITNYDVSQDGLTFGSTNCEVSQEGLTFESASTVRSHI